MELLKLAVIAFVIQGVVVYWAGKFLAWVGHIPPFTIRSLIKNRGWAVWEENDEQSKCSRRKNDK